MDPTINTTRYQKRKLQFSVLMNRQKVRFLTVAYSGKHYILVLSLIYLSGGVI